MSMIGPPPQSESPMVSPMARKVKLNPTQMFGVPLIMLIPLLALYGVFGESDETLSFQDSRTAVTVQYPTRMRSQPPSGISITVMNRSKEPLEHVNLSIDRSYLDRFSGVQFTPSPEEVTSRVCGFDLGRLDPDQEKTVTADLQNKDFGFIRGQVSVEVGGKIAGRLNLSTLAFP